MRILQISSARHFGGGERHLVDLINGLRRRGHDLFVATTPESPLLAELQDLPDNKILRLRFRQPLNIASVWKLRQFVREQQIQIVHAHVARDYPLAALTARTSAPRLVLTRHVLFPMSSFHRLTRQRVARVIAVSEAVAASLRSQKIFADDQITVVRHGIDLERFRPRSTSQTSGTLRVAMIGELSPVKGSEDFVKAAAAIAAERNDVQFALIGRDNSANGEYLRKLRQQIEALSLSQRVELIESKIDVTDFLSTVDVLVSASQTEAFGLAIAEAMACGVSVVATMTEGAREIIDDKETGRLVPIGDSAELARVTLALLADRGERRRLAANALQMITEQFSLPRMIAETEQVYDEVLRESKSVTAPE